jgi:hypothetical protein
MSWSRMGSGCIDSRILGLGTSCRWVVSFKSRPLCSLGKGRSSHWVGGWMNSRTGLNDVKKRNSWPYRDSNSDTLGHPASSQSLYRLSYPDFLKYYFASKSFASVREASRQRNARGDRNVDVSYKLVCTVVFKSCVLNGTPCSSSCWQHR